MLRDAAAVLFTSEEERRLARESFSPYRCHEQVVNYGTAAPALDLLVARESFLALFPELRNKRLLLFLGRLQEKKGCELLLEAFADILHLDPANLHLVMAGPAANESYLKQLQQLARATGAQSAITFTGMLTGELKWGAFGAADVFVLPSHQENFGIAVVEAMACGTPVLVSNKVNIWREIVGDGAGFADEDDRDGTTRLLQRWLELPPDRRRNKCGRPRELRLRRGSKFNGRRIHFCGSLNRAPDENYHRAGSVSARAAGDGRRGRESLVCTRPGIRAPRP